MISYIQGKLKEKQAGKVIIETDNGFGFEILVSEQAQREIGSIGKTVKVFTHCVFKQQDGVFEIFGFFSQEEKQMFLLLTSVDKIGPRTALNVLGSLPLDKLKSAIQHGKREFLNKVVGIGEKTASRLVFELQKKIKTIGLSGEVFDADVEVEEALVSLGYSEKEIKRVIGQMSDEPAKVSERVAMALRLLSGR